MSDYYHGSYIGPLQSLYGRCAILRPCKETYENPGDTRMVVAQFHLLTYHPNGSIISLGWHRFEADHFEPLKPLPE